VRIFPRLVADIWKDVSGISPVKYTLLLTFVAGGIIIAAVFLRRRFPTRMTTSDV
jgi:Flp pilus assembly pilin Flp